ncbi:MAG: CDP-alcohol phosphatidyltransferase family protein, partial [Patescibacteria group bacterium]
RKREEVTELGELLDPFVDFLFFIIVGLSFSLKGIKEINWFLIPLGFIILSFVLPSLKLKKFKTPHTKMKFLHTTCIYILTAMILLDIDFHFFFWITFTIFSIISFELFLRNIKFYLAQNKLNGSSI